MRHASLLGPLVILPLGRSLFGPPVAYILVFVPDFSHCGRRLFGRGSNIRYTHLKKLTFSLTIVFILSQSDMY